MKAITRIFITVLALLVATASVSVFAADSTLKGKSDGQSIDVQAKYVDGVESPDVYSIDDGVRCSSLIQPPAQENGILRRINIRTMLQAAGQPAETPSR